MTALTDWFAGYDIALPGGLEWLEIAIAGGLALVSLAVGVIGERALGPRLSHWWKSHVAHHGEGLGDRMGRIVRHGAAALLLALVLVSHDWGGWAGAPIGIALGAAAAALVHEVLRGLGIPRWATWTVAAVVFVTLFSRAVGGLQPITDTLDAVGVNIGKRRLSLLALISILVTVIALLAVVRLATRVVSHAIAGSAAFDPTQKILAQKLAGIGIVVAGFFVGIDLVGVDLTAFAFFSGAMGLAVGFGLQKTVGNLIAGIILLMDRSIKPGDVIVVGDSFGWVNKIGVRAVSVVTRDGKEHLIPNENLMTTEVENWSYSDRNVRVRIPVSVAYDCDLKLAQQLMLKAATDSPRVLKSPKPNVWLSAYGNDGVEHEILAWISDPEGGVGNVKSDVLNRLWYLLKDAKIDIPFAQRDIYVKSWPKQPVIVGDAPRPAD